MIPARNYRHARESGHPGRAGTAFAALGPRFRGGGGKEELGTICLVHTTSTISSSARTGKAAAWCLGFSLIVGMLVEDAVALGPDPQSNVRGFYDTLVNTMKNGRSLGQSGL